MIGGYGEVPFAIERVVPWGRSFAEYRAMFSLEGSDLRRRIIGCGDGPASFNAEMSAHGHAVVSVDPLYGLSAVAIEQRLQDTFPQVMAEMRLHAHDFVWEHIESIPELGRIRMNAMRQFLSDYPRGKVQGRYVEGALPDLPFRGQHVWFKLCRPISSSCTASSSTCRSTSGHWKKCFVFAQEVRVFPLLQNGGAPSPHCHGVI